MKQYLRHLGPVLITCIFAGAMYLLYQKLQSYSLDEVRNALVQIPHWRLLASVALMLVNYMILIGYDWLALVAINKPLSLKRVSLVSFIGQTVSYNFGALLGGTTVRYRFYATWGFSVADIVRLVLMLAVTFWVGALGLCGLVFMVNPPIIPEEFLHAFPIKDIRLLGGVLFSVAIVYFIACHFVRKTITLFGKEFSFPPLKVALLQAIVAGIDLIVAAGCMYILFSPELGISFGQFLPSYLMAQVAVVLTHIPGGVGVFELVILHLTNTPNEQMVIAVVLCFRIIYFILPLLMAALLLATYEIRQNKGILRDAGRWLSVLSHSINARITFGVGSLFLLFTALPVWHRGHFFLSINWPHPMAILLHALCALSGTILLFLAYGLEIRQAKAWRYTLFFASLGIICAILKGIHLFGAFMLCLLLFSVFAGRRRFYRKSFFWENPFPISWLAPSWLVMTGCLLLAYLLGKGQPHYWSWGESVGAMGNLHTLAFIYVALTLVWIWRIIRRRKS